MKKYLPMLVILPLLILAGLFAKVLYNGPRMKEQPHLRAYQAMVLLPPEGAITVQQPERLPAADRAARLANPLVADRATVERGKVYYGYYCVFCHGDSGAGDGPVGESYLPVPTDLRSPKVRQYRDGELLRAMLLGTGHEPVLERVVPPRYRWYLVAYVRWLGGGEGSHP